MKPRTYSEEEALAIALSKDFQPTVPFQTAKTKWSGYCLKCGYPGNPTLSNILRQKSACGYCTGRKQDSTIRLGKMMALGLIPSGDYIDNCTPIHGVCERCHQPIKPTYHNAWLHKSVCFYCAKMRVDEAVAIGKMMAIGLLPRHGRMPRP